MKTNNVILLDKKLLQEVNGGNQQAYDTGVGFGDAFRRALVVCGIVALFL